MTSPTPKPGWLVELEDKFVQAIAHTYVLHGNVRDYVEPGLFLNSSLARRFAARELIVFYNRSAGITFALPAMTERFRQVVQPLQPANPLLAAVQQAGLAAGMPKEPAAALFLLEQALRLPGVKEGRDGPVRGRVLVVMDYSETIAPDRDYGAMSPEDRTVIVTLQRWARDPEIAASGNLVVLVTTNLVDLHPSSRSPQSKIEPISIPLPRMEERLAFVEAKVAETGVHLETGLTARDIARQTAGLPLVLIEDIFARAGDGVVTVGYVKERKDDIHRTEYADLVEVLEPAFGLEAVGGYDEIKASLQEDVIRPLREGDALGAPMAIAFIGAPGTGKTVLAEAIAKGSGFNFIKLRPLRSKWVGDSERNLAKVFDLIASLEPVVIVHDEADREMDPGSEGDSGVSSRMYGMWLQEMSDTRRRGKRVHVFITNYPDRLPPIFWRPGRVDLRYPFLRPNAQARGAVARALYTKYGFDPQGVDFAAFAEVTPGYSGAELERIILAARNLAKRQDGLTSPGQAHLQAALADYIHAEELEVGRIERMALRYCNSRRLVPPEYRPLLEEVHRTATQAVVETEPQSRGRRSL
jgi:transitional endoplasmic reticulum ATPase